MPLKSHIPKLLFVAWSRLAPKSRSGSAAVAVRDPEPTEHDPSEPALDSTIPPHILALLDERAIDPLQTLDIDSAQSMLSKICQVLTLKPEEPGSLGLALSNTNRAQLRRLSLKLAITHCVFPVAFKLDGIKVHDVDLRRPMMGAFAQVFCGTYGDEKVAVKKLRVSRNATESQKRLAIYRESLLWNIAAHEHVLPILGISEDIFPGNMCMVSPWMENGSLKDYLFIQKSEGNLSGNIFVTSVYEWLRQSALGLTFLHKQDIVHGDIHAGNIIIDDAGQARLTDFGLSLLSKAISHGYGSIHGGGADQWRAPELIAPEMFGLDSKRQTFASDVYSFGCTCVELYVGGPPFSNLNAYQLENHIVQGDRPPRPSLPDGRPIADDMWALIEHCWDGDRLQRPSIEDVLRRVTEITHLPLPSELPPAPTLPEQTPPRILLEELGGVSNYIQTLISRPEDVVVSIDILSVDAAQVVVNEMWKLLQIVPGPQDITDVTRRNKLRRLCLKICIVHDILPSVLLIEQIQMVYDKQEGALAGGFSDIFIGSYRGSKVAVKRMRTYHMSSALQNAQLRKAFRRESMIWAPLVHEHVLPFLGISNEVFEGILCIVLPWMERGSACNYLRAQQSQGELLGIDFVAAVDKLMYQATLGLKYLHDEGVVHGDLHAGNVLIDDTGGARLCDFGMSLISAATVYDYGSIHGGGALRWCAPELIDPETFELEASRPTYASDIYSLACLNVELYTGAPPWPELSGLQVVRRVLKGLRPPRPSTLDGILMSDAMWFITKQCWAQDRNDRPVVAEVVRMLKVIVDEEVL